MKVKELLLLFMLCAVFSEARRHTDRSEKQSKAPEPWKLNPHLQRTTLNGSTSKVDKEFARFAWQQFNLGAARNERRTRKEKRNRAMRQQLKMGIPQLRSAIGPQGPRGPPGPRGPKGANISREEMLEEIRNLMNEAAHQKIISSLKPECTELCFQSYDGNKTAAVVDNLKEIHQNVLVPKIVTAFMWEFEEFTNVPKQSRIELDMFRLSEKSGAYGRDAGESRPDTGKFVAPRSGFYMFNARVHMQLYFRDNNAHVSSEDLFSVSICIDSDCKEKTTLEAISGFGPGKRMTVSVGGMLYLKLNQHASLFVENASNYPIGVFDGSQFTGYLMGV